MKLSSIVTAAALAAGCVGAHAANLGAIDLSSGSAVFGNTPVAGSFTDTLTFTLATASTANGVVVAVVNGTQDVDFATTNGIVLTGPGGTTVNFASRSADPVEVWALPDAGVLLPAGAYTLTLTGTNSASIGSYAGNIAVTAVPEPQTLALMVAGVLGVGWVTRRRRTPGSDTIA